jgi:hypothetical protein
LSIESLNERIRECLQHAEDSTHKAADHARESAIRQNYLAMERGWRELAQNLSKLKAL